MESTPTQRIPNDVKAQMLVVAGLFDLTNAAVNLIPFLGQVFSVLISIIGYCLFGLWFMKRGVGFVDPRKAASFFGSGIIEAIPLLNILPGLTLGVFLTILVLQLEDKTGVKTPSIKKV